jgi:hypothetical protein
VDECSIQIEVKKSRELISELERGEGVEVSLPVGALQGNASGSAFSRYFDQTGLLENGEVVGDGRRAEGLVGIESDAQQISVASDLAEDGEASWIGDGAGDGLHLLIGHQNGLGGLHLLLSIRCKSDRNCRWTKFSTGETGRAAGDLWGRMVGGPGP